MLLSPITIISIQPYLNRELTVSLGLIEQDLYEQPPGAQIRDLETDDYETSSD